MRSKLIISLLLAMSLVQSSCGLIVFNDPVGSTELPDDTTSLETSDTTVSAETEPEEPKPVRDLREESEKRLSELVYRDLGASSVIIASAVSANLICPSGETESEVVASRNLMTRAVEEKYGTKILVNPVNVSTMLDEAKAAYASDMYYADLMAVPQSMVGAFYAAGILSNMYSLPFTDYTKEYYYEELNEAAVIGNTLYAVSGAASFDPDSLGCVYFNRELVGDDVYKLVTEGKWTLDKYAELAKNANTLDLVNGHGSGLDCDEYIELLVASIGIKYVTNAKGQLPTLSYMDDIMMSERADEAVDQIYELLFSDKTYTQSGAYEGFDSGELIFYTDRLSSTALLADSDTRWGLLPMPKYDESESYRSPMSSDSPVFCALLNTPNAETSGLVLEALNAVSYEYVEDIYFSTLRDHYLRDNSSINMLEIILSSPYADFTSMMSSGFKNLAGATSEALRNAVTSTASLNAYYNRYSAAAKRELSASAVIY